MSSSDPFADEALPEIDDRLVEPETRYEMWDGELVYVSPADPPHGEREFQLCVVIGAHTAPDFLAADDLLTRTSRIDDIAPDVSVYPAAPHPTTGRRQLAQLCFEVVSTQSLRHAGRKAAKLVQRGVRRVFAIDIKRSRALEWSAGSSAWRELDPAGHIVDPALAVPLPVASLIHEARTDDVVARALLAKRNPVILADRAKRRARGKAEGRAQGKIEGLAQGKAEGRARGKAEAILVLLIARRIAVNRAVRTRILAERDPGQLDRWIVRAARCRRATQLFSDG